MVKCVLADYCTSDSGLAEYGLAAYSPPSGDPVPRMQPNQQFFMRVKRGGVSSSSVRGALNMDGTILFGGSSGALGLRRGSV